MEYLIYFILGCVGGLIGSVLVSKYLMKKPDYHTPVIKNEPAEWQKKASKELDEMLNKIKNQ
jgi:hypothetical protein